MDANPPGLLQRGAKGRPPPLLPVAVATWLVQVLTRLPLFGRSRELCLPRWLPKFVALEGGAQAFRLLYEIGEKIGEGAFGKVYACHRASSTPLPPDQEDRLCVKTVAVRGRHCARVANVPKDEKQALIHFFGALDHPNIVRHHCIVQTSDTLYIVMDRCEGPDLADLAEASAGLMPLEAVRCLAPQIFAALAAVHALGVMHRDVKLENFRFRDTDAKVLQLLDFGAAKPCCGAARTHSVTGTLLYAAPEVFDGFYWRACDLWSAGIVLFLLISGQLPFETSDVTMLRSMHRDAVLTGGSLLRGARWQSVPPAAQRLVRGLLTVDPAERLSAAAAASRQWPLPDSSGGGEGDGASPQVSALKRSSSSSVSIADLKRSYFVWNLAGCADPDEGEGGEGPGPAAA